MAICSKKPVASREQAIRSSQRDGILITDAHARNFPRGLDGVIIPVDPIIALVPSGASSLLPGAVMLWSHRRIEPRPDGAISGSFVPRGLVSSMVHALKHDCHVTIASHGCLPQWSRLLGDQYKNMADAPTPIPAYSSAPVPVTANTIVNSTAVDVTRLIYMLYQDIESQINRADLKAQITLSTSAILAAMVSNLGLGLASPDMQLWSWREWTVATVYGGFIALICTAIAHALLAAFPRSIGKTKKHPEEANLYFTADIVRLSPEVYSQLFGVQHNSDVRDRVLKQIHAKARVLEAKLDHVRKGLKFLSTAMVIWLLVRVLLVVLYSRIPGH